MTAPLVSVVTATRNRPHHLRRALESISKQSLSDLEMVVADDGSEPQYASEYERVRTSFGPRLRFFQAREPNARRGGPGAARNRALEQARGRYIAFLDDDDVWVDCEHLSCAIRALEASRADFYFGNMQGVRNGEIAIPDYLPNTPELVRGALVLDAPPVHAVSLLDFVEAMSHHLVHPDMMVVRREVVTRVPGGFNEKLRYAEDYEWMMRLGDVASGILYRPSVVAHIRLPEADSTSHWESSLDHALDAISAAQQVRAKSINAAIRRCARAREGWSMRRLSQLLRQEGRSRTALSFEWQAFWTYPTLGAAYAVLKGATAHLSQTSSPSGIAGRRP